MPTRIINQYDFCRSHIIMVFISSHILHNKWITKLLHICYDPNNSTPIPCSPNRCFVAPHTVASLLPKPLLRCSHTVLPNSISHTKCRLENSVYLKVPVHLQYFITVLPLHTTKNRAPLRLHQHDKRKSCFHPESFYKRFHQTQIIL